MLRGVLIAPDPVLREQFSERLAAGSRVHLQRLYDRPLTADEMAGVVRAYAPEVVFVETDGATEHLAAIAALGRAHPGVQRVILYGKCDPQVMLRAMQAGVREFLFLPFDAEACREALDRVETALGEAPAPAQPPSRAVLFLPAKPGSGASVLAAQTAMNLARRDLGATLLADLDLDHGIAQFLLNAGHVYTVEDALERIADLDYEVWKEIVIHVRSLDLLISPAGRRSAFPEAPRVRRLIEFLLRLYPWVTMDCSGALDAIAHEAAMLSRRVVLVCQPELACIHLMKEKVRQLRALELEDRVVVVVNRWSRNAQLSLTDIEGLLGLPVDHIFPDAEADLHQAVLTASSVNPASEWGQALARLCDELVHDTAPPKKPQRKRKIEFFSLVPGRFAVENARS